MCGIAGWNLNRQPGNEFFSTLAAIMQQRGDQAYGLFHSGVIDKGVGAILESVPASGIASLSGFMHTRWATQGAIISENSHPFAMGDLVGAHNGIVSEHEILNATYGRSFAVDSMHIFQHILDELPLSTLKGYGAIQYFRNGAYYVGRCNEGDLVVALTDAGCIWASTAEAVDGAIKQAGLELVHYYKVEQGKLYRIEPDGMYTTDETFQMSERPKDAKGWQNSGTTFSGMNQDTTNDSSWWSGFERELSYQLDEYKKTTAFREMTVTEQARALLLRTAEIEENLYDTYQHPEGTGEDIIATDSGLYAVPDQPLEWEQYPLGWNNCDVCGKNTEVAEFDASYVCEDCFYVTIN